MTERQRERAREHPADPGAVSLPEAAWLAWPCLTQEAKDWCRSLSFWKGTGELSLEASTSLAPGVSPGPRSAEEEEDDDEEEEEEEEEGEVAVEEAAGGVAVLEVREVVRPAFCCSRRF